jgi:hypothetical protein
MTAMESKALRPKLADCVSSLDQIQRRVTTYSVEKLIPGA